jgi:hypothetical protein
MFIHKAFRIVYFAPLFSSTHMRTQIRLISLSLLLASLGLLWDGCSTKFQINEDWKETMVVYGLLNQRDTIQYIKINKAFLGEGNNLIYAQEPDSTLYPAGALDVSLQTVANGQGVGPLIPLRDTVIPFTGTSPVFNRTINRLYYTKAKLNGDRTYQLKAVNLKTGVGVKASTGLINVFDDPNVPLNFSLILPDSSYTSTTYTWSSVTNGLLYQLQLTFNYTETDANNVTTSKKVVWNLDERRSESAAGGSNMNYALNGKDILGFLLGQKNDAFKATGVTRRWGNVESRLFVGGTDYAYYREVNRPTTGLLLEKPTYSNIINLTGEKGLGLLSSRTSKRFRDRKFVDTTLNFLAGQGLGFVP